jgi:hypothetical protein
VAGLLLPNTEYHYRRLSALTAKSRREGTFPDLIDTTRGIQRPLVWTSAADAQRWLRKRFRLDRTEGQDVALYLGVEKRGQDRLLDAWFGKYGIPILPLAGYVSQGFVQEVQEDVLLRDGRPAVLIYAGDFDASGEDIDPRGRLFVEHRRQEERFSTRVRQ